MGLKAIAQDMVQEPTKYTDDILAGVITFAWLAGIALEPHGYGFTIPTEIVSMVLAWAFRGIAATK